MPERITPGSQKLSVPPADAWRAVSQRDDRFDGRFVYAVASTGVFCRPSCPSRRPRRDGVRFFGNAVAASAAGYRPCKRCRPDAAASRADAAVKACLAYLHAHVGQRVTLSDLADSCGMHAHHLQRVFTQRVGVSPREFHDALRQRRFVERLRAGDTVSRATFEAGYGSSSRVYGRREVRAAMTPAVYRRRASGAQIRFATVAVPLGRLLVAFTAAGICAVELGDDDAKLERALRADFSGAEITREPAAASAWVAAVVEQAHGRAPSTRVPLDAQGTAFQWKVWKALQRIPRGETRSYADVARAIGAPTAVRAVAGACARNPVALVVPCHRVVRTDGALGGYRWGVERKARLLERERADAGAAMP